jgi:hypothetical protein
MEERSRLYAITQSSTEYPASELLWCNHVLECDTVSLWMRYNGQPKSF